MHLECSCLMIIIFSKMIMNYDLRSITGKADARYNNNQLDILMEAGKRPVSCFLVITLSNFVFLSI